MEMVAEQTWLYQGEDVRGSLSDVDAVCEHGRAKPTPHGSSLRERCS